MIYDFVDYWFLRVYNYILMKLCIDDYETLVEARRYLTRQELSLLDLLQFGYRRCQLYFFV